MSEDNIFLKEKHWLESVARRASVMRNMLKWNGKWTCIGVWKNKLMEQEGSLWFLPQNTGVTWGGEEEVDSGGCCWLGGERWWGGVLKHLERRLERKHMKSISASLSPLVFSPPPPYFPLCHLREVSQCCGEGPSPAPIINGIIGAYGIT